MVEEEEKDMEGTSNKWQLLTQLVQFIWEHGYIPEQMTWTMTVLLPKDRGGHHGIGLLEPCLKAMESNLEQQLLTNKFHNLLHGSINMKGTGTVTIEVKLAQQLAFLDQKPLHQIFLDLHKAYDTTDCEKTFKILAGYSIDPKGLRIIKHF